MKKMTTDPAIYIIAASLLGGAIGFFGCALFASHAIRRAEQEFYREGFDACNRATNQPRI